MGERAEPTAEPVADDGLPKVDVIELATAILMQGARKETMVSQREIRAMAAALIDFNEVLLCAASLCFLIVSLYGRPDSQTLRRCAELEVERIRDHLIRLDMYHYEDPGYGAAS